MSFLIGIALAGIAFAVSAWLTRRFCDPGSIVYMLDHPNERSLHDRPVPRGGGLAILASVCTCGIAAVYLLKQPVNLSIGMIAGSSVLVAGVSYIDDRITLPPVIRFIVHLSAAALLVFVGFVVNQLELPGLSLSLPYWIAVGFTLLFVVWMLNLYNFMDGMDGFAGGMAVYGFGTFAVLGLLTGDTLFAVLNLIIAAAALGFLVFNFPPARIFMGDAGSSTLGFLAASMSLWAVHERLFPLWVAVLVFSPFVVDSTVTLIRRLLRGEKVWQAHKTHYYQKLVQAGWGHRRTVLLEYAIMLGCGATALWAVHAPARMQLVMLTGWALFYSVFFYRVSWLATQHHKSGTL